MPLAHLDLTLEYAHLDGLRRLLPTFEARITDEDYQATAGLGVSLPGGAPGGFPQSRGRNEQRRGRLPGQRRRLKPIHGETLMSKAPYSALP